MPNRTEAALRKQRLRMPPGDYRYCACSRLHSKPPSGLGKTGCWALGQEIAMVSRTSQTSNLKL
jgi:hypothetical protein